MKNRVLTGLCVVMLFLPWSILLLRTHAWALQSPAAEILIAGYAVFMIFSGIFTLFVYRNSAVRGLVIKICLLINGLYALAGAAALAMMFL